MNHIIRASHNKENPYLQVSKKSIWDENLSNAAVGLWVRFLSKPINWKISVEYTAKECKTSTYQIYQQLNELLKNGYAYRHYQYGIGQSGKKVRKSTIYLIFEDKMTQDELLEFKKSFLLLDFQDLGNLDFGNRDVLINKEEEKKIDIKEKGGGDRVASLHPPPISMKSSKKEKKVTEVQCSYGEYVKMKPIIYKDLCVKYGEEYINNLIDKINAYIPNRKEGPYRDYKGAIMSWILKDREWKKNKGESARPQENQDCVERNKKIAEWTERKLQPFNGQRVYMQAYPDGALFVHRDKDIQMKLLYKEYNSNSFKQMILNEVKRMFPRALDLFESKPKIQIGDQ